MEAELDLRVFMRALLRGWWIIVLCAVGFAAAAFGYTQFIAPRLYSAAALVYINPPPFQFTLDSSIRLNMPSDQVLRTINRIAVSQTVLDATLDAVRDRITLPGAAESDDARPFTGDRLRGFVSLQAVEPTIFNLTARWRDGEGAAVLAEAWAQAFTDEVNRVVGYQDADRLTQLEGQLSAADSAYSAAQAALVAFGRTAAFAELEAQRDALAEQYSTLLRQSSRIDLLLVNIDTLRAAFSALPPGTPVAPGDILAVLNIQNASLTGDSGSPVTLQIGGGLTTSQTYSDLLSQLDAFSGALSAQQTTLTDQSAALQAELRDAEAALLTAANERERLEGEVQTTRDDFRALTGAIDALRVAADPSLQLARIAVTPQVPQNPSEPRVTTTTLLAGVIGAAVGLLIVLLSAVLRPAPAPVRAADSPVSTPTRA